jgi:HK97 gp10 family phage protein
MADVQVSGLADLQKMLQGLPARVEVNVMRGAIRAGQKVIADEAKRRVPKDTGDLAKSIKVKTNMRAQRRGMVRADVVAGDKQAWYSHLIEFGTGQHYTGTGKSVRRPYVIRAKGTDGKEASTAQKRRALRVGGAMVAQVTHPGIRPRPFMRPAAELLTGPALEAFAGYVRKRLPRELAKAAP